jgi:predicted phosphate transport protein (TIGR00153 family)
MAFLFTKTKKIELQIEEFLDMVIQGGLIFRQGMKFYFEKRDEEFESRLLDLRKMEEKADVLRRTIENKLYLRTLIPESRGDVLGLLESTDKVLNTTADTMLEFSVEIPDIIESMHPFYLDLVDSAFACVENTVGGIRAYFRNVDAVQDHINKVMVYRKETNKVAENLKRKIFRTELDLSHKIHMRYFSYHIERIAEEAEDVCDRLAIASIKKFE